MGNGEAKQNRQLRGRSFAGQKETGPYCWAGNEGGKDKHIPCGKGLTGASTAVDPNWLTLDLPDFAGLRILIDGKVYYVRRSDISIVLADLPYAKP
jgi:hypothetical protein